MNKVLNFSVMLAQKIISSVLKLVIAEQNWLSVETVEKTDQVTGHTVMLYQVYYENWLISELVPEYNKFTRSWVISTIYYPIKAAHMFGIGNNEKQKTTIFKQINSCIDSAVRMRSLNWWVATEDADFDLQQTCNFKDFIRDKAYLKYPGRETLGYSSNFDFGIKHIVFPSTCDVEYFTRNGVTKGDVFAYHEYIFRALENGGRKLEFISMK